MSRLKSLADGWYFLGELKFCTIGGHPAQDNKSKMWVLVLDGEVSITEPLKEPPAPDLRWVPIRREREWREANEKLWGFKVEDRIWELYADDWQDELIVRL